MATYVRYECNVCRRIKDVLKDNYHAAINQCTITKGCLGHLFKISETDNPTSTPTINGVVDWYPRGSVQATSSVASEDEMILMSNSSNGNLVLAIYQSDIQASERQKVILKLSQRKVDDISYQTYAFKLILSTNQISGKDISGKNLRFDQLAIDDGRVSVRVNGISRFQGTDPDELVLTPNTITFNTAIDALSTVDVTVYSQKTAEEKKLTFSINYISKSVGAWNNIRWVKEYSNNGELKIHNWWIYTCSSLANVAATSKLKVEGIYSENDDPILVNADLVNSRLLLSSYPYENPDRYLNLYMDMTELNLGYNIASTTNGTLTELSASKYALTEIYPPFQLIVSETSSNSSYISADVFTSSSAIQSDTRNTHIQTHKILGPL